MTQGALLPSAYDAYARYFVKYVQEYEAAGVPIFAVTMQNEPMHVPHDYPGLGMMATEQAAFLRDHLGPAFQKADLSHENSGLRSQLGLDPISDQRSKRRKHSQICGRHRHALLRRQRHLTE